ncbi:hypothetical protein SAMN05421810_103583 [Amycolatopsis arida]|uniref:Uncharacterized protein n=1 Tax=Amycolatopsis arida TaxID=587909 RepID=A0A1I5TMP3_9PSEU|nr:hypothetical protein [Amycolatopsis arida]TDX96039.1 hypothetical protein CLV69_103174 [Amycolatopsis arida]SFP84342.1 hypothetical protein SAMN05421810_103583 [Amycolatopsis arida]
MQGRHRRTAAVGAAAFVLAGSAALAMPGTAVAETKHVPCGGSVTANPGDRVYGTTPLLGLPLDLGVVTEATSVLTGTINALLGQVCRVTVTVVDTVVKPVPVVGEPAASAINQGVSGATGAAGNITGGSPPQRSGPEPAPESPGDEPGRTGGGPPGRESGAPPPVPESNSPVVGGAALPGFTYLPTSFGSGYAAMRNYSGIPIATAGLFAPSPGVRYGGQVPGYAPEFGILGAADAPPDDGVRNAGRAEALPGGGSGDRGNLPMLLAVLALSGVSAALVRTWVLRKATAS